MKRFVWCILCIAICFPESVAEAQIDSRSLIEDVFQAGLRSFRQGRFDEALTSFDVVLEGPLRNHRTTAAYIMAGKAAYRAGMYGRVRRYTTDLLDLYPRTSYADQALYLRALSEFRLRDYDLAASDLIRIAGSRPSPEIKKQATVLLDDILFTHLPVSALRRLSNLQVSPEEYFRIHYALAKTLTREGRDTLALDVLESLLTGNLPDSDRTVISEMKAELSAGEKMQIGILLPLMNDAPGGDFRRISDEVLDGIRYATDEFNAGVNPGRQVELLLRDTRFDSVRAGDLASQMAAIAGVRALVGPLFTGEFTSAAKAANDRYLPIISPTATGDGIAELGPYIFQANPDYATRGRAAARYGVRQLGMSSFAVLASDDFVGRSHAESFRKEAERLGATVYCIAYYPPESEDLREAYMKIRRTVMAESTLVSRSVISRPENLTRLLGYGINPEYVLSDTLNPDSTGGDYVSVTTLLGPRGYTVAESLGIPIAVYDTTADETDIPLLGLDALFMALGDPRQMDYIAPQLNYFNIKAQIIGNNEWFDPERLRDNSAYVSGVIFIADSFIESADSSVGEFTSSFRVRRGSDPTKFTLYGYDTMRLLLDQIGGGARSRSEIRRGLSEVGNFRGLHGDMSLTGGRVNGFLHVLQFDGSDVVQSGEVSGKQ